MLLSMEDDEIEFICEISSDKKEVTITVKSGIPLTTGDLVLELEQYIMELSRAEDQRAGATTH